jgi:putative heme-binding domain-containing protein
MASRLVGSRRNRLEAYSWPKTIRSREDAPIGLGRSGDTEKPVDQHFTSRGLEQEICSRGHADAPPATGNWQTSMTRIWLLTLWAGCFLPSMASPAKDQAGATTVIKPVTATLGEINEGASLFRANCSPCHGLEARGGGRGPDLTSGRWAHGSSDAAIVLTISQGVPGTEMTASNFEDSETRAIVAYLRSLSPVSAARAAGNRIRGEQIFWGNGACSTCHMVSGKGGGLGPDLTRVGAARAKSYLIDSIREPSKDLADGMVDPNNENGNVLVYDTVTVVTRTGQRISGLAKNEDTFSIQLLDANQQLHLLLKRDLDSVTHERRSLMPAYTQDKLSDEGLRDLVAYLESLRGKQ